MSVKIGRNDPCHCGSGKKYKRCHLAQDEQRTHTVAPVSSSPGEAAAPAVLPKSDASAPSYAQIPHLLRKLARTGTKAEREEFQQVLAEAQPLLNYLERRQEIDAASAALEAHRDEYERLIKDDNGYSERARALFGEDRFAPLWFTAGDIRRAFAQVGTPFGLMSGDRTVETLRAALLCLADKERRHRLTSSLLLQLPDYVAAGRHLDGWLIQDLAYQTSEDAEESNPFLFEMFAHGYDAWAQEQHARQEAVLHEAGWDLEQLRGMSLTEIDDLLRAQADDPARRARMEAILAGHPDQRAEAIADLQTMERDSIRLLERAEAVALLLPPAQSEPWVAPLGRCWEEALAALPGLADGTAPKPAAQEALLKAVMPVLRQMAQSIFTPERIRRVLAQLRQCRDQQYAAGDKQAAYWAVGAITSLEGEDSPADNYFLLALCFASLQTHLAELADGENEKAEDGATAPEA